MMTFTSQLHWGWGYKRMNAMNEGVSSSEILGVDLIGLN